MGGRWRTGVYYFFCHTDTLLLPECVCRYKNRNDLLSVNSKLPGGYLFENRCLGVYFLPFYDKVPHPFILLINN